MTVVLVFVWLISFSLGRYPVSLLDVGRILLSRIFPMETTWPEAAEIALFNIRLPRLLLGMFVGGGLSMAGSAYQAVFANPLVSPDVLGASGGAGFGAALAILLSVGAFGLTVSSFFFGLLAVLLVVLIAGRVRYNRVLGFILTGMVLSSLFSAALSFLKLVADPQNQLPAITYWLMGSLNGTTMFDVYFAGPTILLGMLVLVLLRWQLNIIVLGDEEAKTMGVMAGRIRLIVVFAATLITAASVSVTGMVGWIGLVIPHVARMTVGADHRYQLPASGFLGAIFLLLVDNASRLIASSEIPLGILTAFIGAPFFLWLILREGRQ